MENVHFTVIMPCYNSAAYVTKAIESVVNQTYPFWELIVINDGSYDNTLAIVNQYSSRDERVKVFSKENGGYATAVNYGLDKVTGDYFLFLGSDDYLDIYLFEKLSDYFQKYALLPDMVAFRTQVVDENGTIKGTESYTQFEQPLLTRATFKEFNVANPKYSAIFSIRDTSRCYRTTLLGDTRYFGKTGIDADGIFSMLISHKATTFLNLPVDGYYWYIRSGSVSSSTTLPKHLDKINNWHSFFEVIVDAYEAEITKNEKDRIVALSHLVVELSSSPANALKYRKFIKQEAKFCISLANHFRLTPLKYIHIVVKSPLLYSFIYGLRSVIKNDRKGNKR